MRMRRMRWLLYVVPSITVLLISWWFLVRTPAPSATIGHFGDNRFLCVKPGQVVRLRFSKPLPTGIDEFYKQWKNVVVYANREAIAEGRYWGGLSLGTPWRIISEREVIFQVPDWEYGPVLMKYPFPNKTKGGERFEFMLFIMGDGDLDRLIQRQEPLPPDGKIPSKGNVEVYYVEPSAWERIRFWLYNELVRKRGIDIGL